MKEEQGQASSGAAVMWVMIINLVHARISALALLQLIRLINCNTDSACGGSIRHPWLTTLTQSSQTPVAPTSAECLQTLHKSKPTQGTFSANDPAFKTKKGNSYRGSKPLNPNSGGGDSCGDSYKRDC